MNLFRSVVSLGTKFLRLFSSPPPMDVLPLCILPIGDHMSAKLWYHGLITSLRTREDVMGCAIDEIVWYKEQDLVAHEFLVASVRMTNHRGPVLLKFERSISKEILKKIIEDPNGSVTAFLGQNLEDVPEEARTDASRVPELLKAKVRDIEEQEAKSNKVFSLSDSLNSSKKDPAVANDLISRLDPDEWKPAAYIQLSSLRFGSETPFTLRDMGIIVYHVHISQPTYDWKTRNCYWFSKTLMKIIPNITNATPAGLTEKLQRAGRPGLALRHFPFPPAIFKTRFDRDVVINEIKLAIRTDDERLEKIWKDGPGETIRANIAEESNAKLRREKEESEAKFRREKEESEAKWSQEREAFLQQLAQYRAGPGPASASIAQVQPIPA